jgi:hypothetical protein
MPVSLISATPNRLLAVAAGNVTLEELVDFVARHRSGEQRLIPLLLDFTDTSTDMPPDDIRSMATYLTGQIDTAGPRARVAVIAPGNVMYGVMRMLMSYGEMLSGMDHVAVFRSIDEAEAWLK